MRAHIAERERENCQPISRTCSQQCYLLFVALVWPTTARDTLQRTHKMREHSILFVRNMCLCVSMHCICQFYVFRPPNVKKKQMMNVASGQSVASVCSYAEVKALSGRANRQFIIIGCMVRTSYHSLYRVPILVSIYSKCFQTKLCLFPFKMLGCVHKQQFYHNQFMDVYGNAHSIRKIEICVGVRVDVCVLVQTPHDCNDFHLPRESIALSSSSSFFSRSHFGETRRIHTFTMTTQFNLIVLWQNSGESQFSNNKQQKLFDESFSTHRSSNCGFE